MSVDPSQTPRPDLSALRIQRDEEPEESSLKRNLIRLVILAVVAGVVWLIYAGFVAPRRRPVVETMTVRPTVMQTVQPTLSATGYLVAHRQATITPKVSGRITQLHFDVGDVVAAGEVLAVLESAELRTQLDEANAGLSEATREYRRQRALFDQGVTSRALLDSAEAQMQAASARVRRVRVNLRDTVVRAPFAGTITAKSVEIGENVASVAFMQNSNASADGGSIATLADLSTLELEADVNESNVGQLRPGQPAEITVDAFPQRRWRGRLRQIVPRADRAKGVVKVKVAIIDPKEGLLPDMSASVSFLETERTASDRAETAKLWIPASAVLVEGGRSFVVRLDEKVMQVERVPVSVGAVREGRAEITSGLAEGDRIVTNDPAKFADGITVRTAEQK